MSVPQPVVDSVLAWANAETLESAAAILAERHRAAKPRERPILHKEVAELTLEALAECLRRSRGPKAVTRLGETELSAKQAERLRAWVEDQPRTARAFGMTVERWVEHLGAALRRLGAVEGTPSEPAFREATKLLGLERTPVPAEPASGMTLLDLRTRKS